MRDAYDRQSNAEAAPATVSDEYLLVTTETIWFWEGEMDATTREPGDLPQTKTSTGGVSEGRVCVRDVAVRALPLISRMSHFGVKSYDLEFRYTSARMTGR